MDFVLGKLKHEAVKLKREAKKVAELESPIERKIREATSNQNWGCPNSILYEITVAAHDFHDRRKITKAFEEKLQSEPHRWRRILKTLTLLEFIIKNCGEDVLPEMLSEQTKVRRLQNFQYSEEGKERGQIVRDKATAIVELCSSQPMLKEAREEARKHRGKMVDGAQGSASSGARRSNQVQEVRSRASMEARFNEMKTQRDADKAREAGDRESRAKDSERRERERDEGDRNRRRSDSPRDFSRDGYDIHIAPPGADGGGAGTQANVMDIALNSDSDDEICDRLPAARVSPRDAQPANAAPPVDLLDFGEPAGNSASSGGGDWGAFDGSSASSGGGDLLSGAPASSGGLDLFSAQDAGAGLDLLGGPALPQNPVAVDTGANKSVTDMFDMDFQAPGRLQGGYQTGGSAPMLGF